MSDDLGGWLMAGGVAAVILGAILGMRRGTRGGRAVRGDAAKDARPLDPDLARRLGARRGRGGGDGGGGDGDGGEGR